LVICKLITFTFQSCKKEDINQVILGYWLDIDYSSLQYSNDVLVSEQYGSSELFRCIKEFLKDGTGREFFAGIMNYTFTWSLDGNSLQIVRDKPDPNYRGTDLYQISLKDDTLTYITTFDDMGFTYEITNIAVRKKSLWEVK